MEQGRSTKIIWMIKWIRTSGLSIKNSLFLGFGISWPFWRTTLCKLESSENLRRESNDSRQHPTGVP